MNWNPVILGIVDDPYSNNFWVLPLLSIFSLSLCYYRYKTAWVLLPIVTVVFSIFLAGFLEPQTYNAIQFLTHRMPQTIAAVILLFLLPFIAAYFGWRKSKPGQNNLP